MLKIDHIGIAVKNLSTAREVYSTLMNEDPYKKEVVESEKMTALFYQAGDTKIELMEATAEDSAIRKFIEKRGEGIHHIAFHVPDINQAMLDLKSKGYSFVHETPQKGPDNKLVVFVKPRGTHGVMIELCQTI